MFRQGFLVPSPYLSAAQYHTFFSYTGLSLLWLPFHPVLLRSAHYQAFPISLATTSGISVDVFLELLRCFSSPGSPPHLRIQYDTFRWLPFKISGSKLLLPALSYHVRRPLPLSVHSLGPL